MDWKNRSYACIIGLLLLCVPCQAGIVADVFYEFLNQSKTITHVDDIVYSSSEYVPDKTTQSSQHIRGWVDIIGFQGTVRINGTEYLNVPRPVILYEVWDEGITSNNNVDYIKITDERITTENNITTVEFDIHMKWHHSTLKTRMVNGKPRKYIKKDYYHEYTTFTASAPTPLAYPDIELPVYKVVVYNSSIKPKTVLHLPENDYILGYQIKFMNESIEYFKSVLSVEKQDNGFPIANVTQVQSQSIYEGSEVFSRIGSNIIINSTEINDNLKIYALSPYERYEINYTVTNYSDTPMLDSVQLSSAFGLLMSGWIIVFIIKHYRR